MLKTNKIIFHSTNFKESHVKQVLLACHEDPGSGILCLIQTDEKISDKVAIASKATNVDNRILAFRSYQELCRYCAHVEVVEPGLSFVVVKAKVSTRVIYVAKTATHPPDVKRIYGCFVSNVVPFGIDYRDVRKSVSYKRELKAVKMWYYYKENNLE